MVEGLGDIWKIERETHWCVHTWHDAQESESLVRSYGQQRKILCACPSVISLFAQPWSVGGFVGDLRIEIRPERCVPLGRT